MKNDDFDPAEVPIPRHWRAQQVTDDAEQIERAQRPHGMTPMGAQQQRRKEDELRDGGKTERDVGDMHGPNRLTRLRR